MKKLIVTLVVGSFLMGIVFSFGIGANAAGTVSMQALLTKANKGIKSVGVGIAQLKRQMNGVKSKVAEVGQKVDATSVKVDGVKSVADSMNGKVDAVNSKVDTMDINTRRAYWNTYITCYETERELGLNPDDYCWNPNE